MIEAQKVKVEPFHRGSGRLSPSEIFDAGYRDGLNHRTNYSLYNKNSQYTQGHIAGYRARPGGLFSLSLPTQAPLEQGWGDERLNAI